MPLRHTICEEETLMKKYKKSLSRFYPLFSVRYYYEPI